MPILSTSLIKRIGASGLTNAGSFASFAALEAAWPSPQDGMFAAVGIDGSSGDEALYLSDGGSWHNVSAGGGGVPEAPVDGTGYVRKDAAWAAESTGGGAYAELKTADFTAENAKQYVTGGSVTVTDIATPDAGDFFQVMVGPGDAEIDGVTYADGANVLSVYDGADWFRYDFAAGGGIPDAPSDGNLYGRKDGAWEQASVPQDMFLKSYEGAAVSGYFGKWIATRAGTLQQVVLQSGNQLPVGSNAVAQLLKNGSNVLSATLEITTTESPTNGNYVGAPVSTFTSAAFVAGDVFIATFPSAPGSTTPIVDPVMVVRASF